MVLPEYYLKYEKLLSRLKMESQWIDAEKRIAELRYNHNHDDKGRFCSDKNNIYKRYSNGGRKSVDKSEKSGIIKSSDEISATGANKFKMGFSQTTLDNHWKGGKSDHSDEYPGFTKEQYANRALELIQSAADGKNIFGYKLPDGSICRYDVNTNDFVKGHPMYGIYTMFKPQKGSAYFHSKKKLEGGITNDN